MFIKVDLSTFRDQFKAYGRADQFSYEGLELLFEHLEELEFCEEPYQLDVIALCCDFAESDAFELIESYDIDVSDIEVTEQQVESNELLPEIEQRVTEFLEENTTFCGVTDSGSFVYQQF